MDRELAIVVVGDEILQARRTEANAAWMARKAAEAGLRLREIRVVSDEPGDLLRALGSLRRPGLEIVTTGGLGPTRDDRTRAEVAAFWGRSLVRSERAYELVCAAYARRERPLDPADDLQFQVPEGAEILVNPTGTAPGFRLEAEGFAVTSLPGVPSEVRAMWEHGLGERLSRTALRPGTAKLFTTGLGESEQESRMRDLALEGVEFCSLPGPWGVEIQCLVREGERLDERARDALEKVAARLGEDHVIHPLGTGLVEAIAVALRRRIWRIALAESCTAGLAASTLAGFPGVSDVLLGGVVAYDNVVKTELLGVSEAILRDQGAVSRECAEAMAAGVRVRLGSEVGLAVTGVAGPGGGSPEKPVGTVWIAAATPKEIVSERLTLVGSREEIRTRAAWRLLSLAWRLLR